jgi:hypothetical protein
MVLSGPRRISAISSLTNRGSIFGSMAGTMPLTGRNPNLASVIRLNTNFCKNKCIPFGPVDGFNYMNENGMIQRNKHAGGISRVQSAPGIKRLVGSGSQGGWTY